MMGVRQGCLLSSIIFAAVIYWVMRRSVDLRDEGLMWQKSKLTDTDFADDTALLANNKEVQRMTDAVAEMAGKFGLAINEQRSEAMGVGEDPPPNYPLGAWGGARWPSG